MKKILSLILAFSFFASEANFMDKVKALPGKAKEFALATKDAAKANKPKAIFTTLQIAVAAHRLHALGMPESKGTLFTEDTNNFFSLGKDFPYIHHYFYLFEDSADNTDTIINKNSKNMDISSNPRVETSTIAEEAVEPSSPGGKVDNSDSKENKPLPTEGLNRSSSSRVEPSPIYATADNSDTIKNKNSKNTGCASDMKKYSTEDEEELSQATGEADNSDTIKNKNLRPIKYVQDFFNDGIGGTLFILEILKRLTTKAK